MTSIGVIGGGIAGLTAAYRLQTKGFDVTLFEQSDYVGGKIRSERTEGYLIEHGPNALQTTTPLLETLIEELGLQEDYVEASESAKKRYIVLGGMPVPLPTSITSFLSSELFSPGAKFRLLIEPFVSPADADTEESVADFARRRLGPELLDYGLNPFVGGVFAGDPERLSLRHAFPRLHILEQEHGSLLLGQLRQTLRALLQENTPRRKTLFSFQEGLQTLPDALAEHLGEAVQRRSPITALRHDGNAWVLTVQQDDATTDRRFDAVLYAAPLHRLSDLDFETGLDLTPLAEVTYPPLSILYFGVPRGQVDHPLDGFGLLVPEAEKTIDILGTLFSSTLFSDRAPADHVLLTTFVGGARHPGLARADTETLVRKVRRALGRLVGLRDEPTFVRHVYWEHAIPQYETGYNRVKARIEELEAELPSFFMAGNYRQGISVGDAATSGATVAHRIIQSAEAGAAA